MNTKLYIGTEQADFNEAFNVMFSIRDIRSMSFGSANRSYTLNLPLTRTNKRLLKFISQPDVRTEPTATGRLYLGDMLVISGRIIVQSHDDYSAKIYIEQDTWIEDLKEKKMTALDLSTHDHALTNANVLNSWSAAYPAYRYPMIDFGGLQSGESGASANWYPTDFIPMISIKTLIEKILSPFTVTSTWLSTTFIKDLFILARETIAAEAYLKNKQLTVSTANDTDNQDLTSIPGETAGNSIIDNAKCILSVETSDEGADWSNDTYTVPETGTYRFKTVLTLHNNAPDQPDFTITNEEVTIDIKSARGAVITTLGTISAAAYVATELIKDITYTVTTEYFHLEAGDEVYVEIYIECSVTNNGAGAHDLTIGVKSASTFENIWGICNRYSGLNKTISLEEMLPDITQLDFLACIRDLANLVFWFDRSRRVMYIEPWDSFVSSTVVDLTSYIDFANSPGELIASNYSQNIYLRWRDDSSDEAFKEYYKYNTATVGEKSLTLTSVFTKQNIDYRDHSFSTMMTGKNLSISDYTNDYPRIYAEMPVSPYMMFNRKTGFNTRLVEWKGLTAGLSWYYDSVLKNTYPKVQGVTWSDLYINYWIKYFHYVDKGKIYAFRMKVTPGFLNQFFSVVATATSEAFRPTYKITTNGIDNYYFMQKLTTDGSIAEIEMVLKQ